MRLLIAISAAFQIMSFTALGQTSSPGGTVTVSVAGNFKIPVTSTATVTCSAAVFLVPNSLAGSSVGNSLVSALLQTGAQQASAPGVITGTGTGTSFVGTNFTCAPTVQYRWQNINATTSSMGVLYTVKASNPPGFDPTCLQNAITTNQSPYPLCLVNGTNPGKVQEILTIMPVPPASTVTPLSVSPKL